MLSYLQLKLLTQELASLRKKYIKERKQVRQHAFLKCQGRQQV